MTPDLDINDQIGQGRIIILTIFNGYKTKGIKEIFVIGCCRVNTMKKGTIFLSILVKVNINKETCNHKLLGIARVLVHVLGNEAYIRRDSLHLGK